MFTADTIPRLQICTHGNALAKTSPNAPCPCGRTEKYKKCCRRWHNGAPAPTPEDLMRSRFTAYSLGLVDYILSTSHPDGPHGKPEQRDSVTDFCAQTAFQSLEVLSASEDGHRGEVSFYAHLSVADQDASFGERSTFYRVDGRWLYHSGTPIQRT